LTANVLDRNFDEFNSGAISRASELEYDGVAQLDYHDLNQDRIGSNQLQLEARFQGPRHTLQSNTDQFVVATLLWRHKLGENLLGFVQAQDVLGTQNNVTVVTTDDYRERTELDSAGARVRFALTYQFGAQTPQRDQPSSIPGAGGQ
jgi:hypothetical protein